MKTKIMLGISLYQLGIANLKIRGLLAAMPGWQAAIKKVPRFASHSSRRTVVNVPLAKLLRGKSAMYERMMN